MRNLTLGALIVILGIVAALPFRRAPDTSGPVAAELSMATGPPANMAATDDPVTLDHWFTGPTSSGQHRAVHSRPGSPTSLASGMRSPEAGRGIPSDAVAQPRRDLRVPLTYEDLAVPLATPQYTDGRFDALASGQQVQRNADAQQTPKPNAIAISDRPAFESMQVGVSDRAEQPRQRAPWEMASDLPQSILETQPDQQARPQASSPASRITPPTLDITPSSVQGRLASDSQSDRKPTAKASEPARPRLWIRQPD